LHNPSIYTFRLKVSLPFVIRRSFLCSSFENTSSNCTCRVRCTLNMPASCLVSPFSCALVQSLFTYYLLTFDNSSFVTGHLFVPLIILALCGYPLGTCGTRASICQ
jgi:hypothetical protein